MKSVQTDNKKKKARAIKAALAVLMTLAELLFAGAMLSAYREMCHEGLTYSQWYEGSIQGFYSSVAWFLGVTLPFIAAWIVLIFDFRGVWEPRWMQKMTKQRWGGVFLAFMFALIALLFGREGAKNGLELARAANEESIAWRFEQVGRYEVLMTLAGQGYLLALGGMIKEYIKEQRNSRQSGRKAPSGKKARRKAMRRQSAAAKSEEK